MSKQVLDRLPGETGTDFSRFVSEYLSNFKSYKIKKDYAQRDQLYEWCAKYMGQQYKDWFVYEGGKQDKWWCINIRSPKHCTVFSIRWADIIIESIDRSKE